MKWPTEPVAEPGAGVVDPFYEGSFLRMILNRMSRMLHQVRTSVRFELMNENKNFSNTNVYKSILIIFVMVCIVYFAFFVELRHEPAGNISSVASGIYPAPKPERIPIGRIPPNQGWRKESSQYSKKG